MIKAKTDITKSKKGRIGFILAKNSLNLFFLRNSPLILLTKL